MRIRSFARQEAVNPAPKLSKIVNHSQWHMEFRCRVNTSLARRRNLIAMDGMNADFAGAKICPAADTCRTSNRTLFGTAISVAKLLLIEN